MVAPVEPDAARLHHLPTVTHTVGIGDRFRAGAKNVDVGRGLLEVGKRAKSNLGRLAVRENEARYLDSWLVTTVETECTNPGPNSNHIPCPSPDLYLSPTPHR